MARRAGPTVLEHFGSCAARPRRLRPNGGSSMDAFTYGISPTEQPLVAQPGALVPTIHVISDSLGETAASSVPATSISSVSPR